jgi:hypothetical protein
MQLYQLAAEQAPIEIVVLCGVFLQATAASA